MKKQTKYLLLAAGLALSGLGTSRLLKNKENLEERPVYCQNMSNQELVDLRAMGARATDIERYQRIRRKLCENRTGITELQTIIGERTFRIERLADIEKLLEETTTDNHYLIMNTLENAVRTNRADLVNLANLERAIRHLGPKSDKQRTFLVNITLYIGRRYFDSGIFDYLTRPEILDKHHYEEICSIGISVALNPNTRNKRERLEQVVEKIDQLEERYGVSIWENLHGREGNDPLAIIENPAVSDEFFERILKTSVEELRNPGKSLILVNNLDRRIIERGITDRQLRRMLRLMTLFSSASEDEISIEPDQIGQLIGCTVEIDRSLDLIQRIMRENGAEGVLLVASAMNNRNIRPHLVGEERQIRRVANLRITSLVEEENDDAAIANNELGEMLEDSRTAYEDIVRLEVTLRNITLPSQKRRFLDYHLAQIHNPNCNDHEKAIQRSRMFAQSFLVISSPTASRLYREILTLSLINDRNIDQKDFVDFDIEVMNKARIISEIMTRERIDIDDPRIVALIRVTTNSFFDRMTREDAEMLYVGINYLNSRRGITGGDSLRMLLMRSPLAIEGIRRIEQNYDKALEMAQRWRVQTNNEILLNIAFALAFLTQAEVENIHRNTNIIYFGRYSERLLRRQNSPFEVNKQVVFISVNQKDYNGAFYNLRSTLETIQTNYNLAIREASSDERVLEQIGSMRTSGIKIKVWMPAGHGIEEGTQYGPGRGEESVLGEEDMRDLGELRDCFEENPIVIFYSCSTGRDHLSIAAATSTTLHATAFAPIEPNSQVRIIQDRWEIIGAEYDVPHQAFRGN